MKLIGGFPFVICEDNSREVQFLIRNRKFLGDDRFSSWKLFCRRRSEQYRGSKIMNDKSAFCSFRIDHPVLFPWGLLGFVLALLLAFPVHAGAQTAHFSYAQVTLAGSFSNPNGVAVDNSGNVFIADTSNNAVKEIPSGCTASTCIATLGSGFSSPYGVAVDGSGNVFVADTGHGAVKEIPSSGGYSTVNTVRGGFSAPVGVALDASGNVFVLDSNYGVVYELLASSAYSSIALVASGFFFPHGLAVDGSGNLFVADTGNSAIWEFMAAGGYIYNAIVSFGSVPDGIAVDASDNLYVGNQNGTVVNKILAAGGYSATIPLGSGFAGPYGIAVNGSGTVFVADTGNSRVVKLDTASVDLGTIAIGQASATIPLTFTFDSGGTIASPLALTQGTSGLDFAIASGGTCTAGTYSAGNACTVNVALSPQYPGLRMGAVALTDASDNAIASVYAHGVGSGPTPSFSPGTQSTLPVAGLNQPFGVTVDAAGNIYIADDGNSRVVKIAAIGGTQSTAGTGLSNPHSVAVDGAGNVYIADYANVYKVSANGSSQTTVAATGLTNPCGVAVDGAGNLYIANCGGSSNFVVEVHEDGSAQTTAVSGLYLTDGVAVDGANNVYIADTGNNRVVKVSATGAQNTVFTGEADDVVVDSAGTIYVAQASASSVVKVPADGSAQSTVGTGLSRPYGVGLDQTGNVYIADSGTNQVVKVDQADAPTLTFASTNVNSTSAAQDVVVGNAGNSSLDISQIVISTNFTLQGPDTNCATNGQTSRPRRQLHPGSRVRTAIHRDHFRECGTDRQRAQRYWGDAIDQSLRNRTCSGPANHAYGDHVADGKPDHLWTDAGVIGSERRSGFGSGQLCLHHAERNSGSRDGGAERDLHANRHDELHHRDRNAEHNREPGYADGDGQQPEPCLRCSESGAQLHPRRIR